MTTLPIQIDDEVAAAFEAAPQETRERVAQLLESCLRAALRETGSRSQRIGEIADRLSASAKANGWTEEMNEALLRGDLDHDG